MISNELKKRVIDAVRNYIDIANTHYKPSVPFPMPRVCFDVRGRTAGYARSGSWEVDFNQVLLSENVETFLARTVPHEVAHLIDLTHVQKQLNGGELISVGFSRRGRRKISKHGPTWESVMRVFGVKDIGRCHSYDITNARVKNRTRYSYSCLCQGKTLDVGPKVHNAIQTPGHPRFYTTRCCRMRMKAEHWVRGAAVPRVVTPIAVPVVQVPDKPTLDTTGMTRQQIVNKIVRDASPGVSSKDIIRKIVVETGMTTAGASTYYYNARKALTNAQQAA